MILWHAGGYLRIKSGGVREISKQQDSCFIGPLDIGLFGAAAHKKVKTD